MARWFQVFIASLKLLPGKLGNVIVLGCSLICVIGSFTLLFSWYVTYFSIMFMDDSRWMSSSRYHYLSKLIRHSDGWLVFDLLICHLLSGHV